MAEEEIVVINLDELNPKLKAKEFKSTMKDVKSKDLLVKNNAITKFNDCRYLTEGGCMYPLIDSMVVKKKTIDIATIGLNALLKFLESEDDISGGTEATLKSLNAVLNISNNLNVFQILSNIMIYKEEVKKVKPKKLKKGEEAVEVPPFVEDPAIIALRCNSLRAVYRITKILSPPSLPDVPLLNAFSNIPGYIINLYTVIASLFPKFQDEQQRIDMLEEGVWALTSLALALRHNEDGQEIILTTDLFDLLHIFMKEPVFILPCLQIYDVMASSKHSNGLLKVESEDNMSAILQVLEKSSEVLGIFGAEKQAELDAAAGGKGGKKDAKKTEAKKGKNEPETPKETNETLLLQGSSDKLNLSYVKIITTTLRNVANQRSHDCVFNEENITRITQNITSVMLNLAVYEVSRDEKSNPLNVVLVDVIDSCCILLGEIGLVNTGLRRFVCDGNSVQALYKVLSNSKSIIGQATVEELAEGEEDDGGAEIAEINRLNKLNNLRRVVCKSILSLVTEKVNTDANMDVVNSLKGFRWLSCKSYSTDESLFSSSTVSINELIDIISVKEDSDLGNRAIRLISALFQSSEDPIEFSKCLEVDASSITKISEFVNLKCNDVSTFLSENSILEASTDPLIPNLYESLYHAFIVLEPLMNLSAENVNLFSSRDRFTVLSQILYNSGATGNGNKIQELSVSLFDSRNFSWLVNEEEKITDNVLLRTLLFDVLNIIACADSTYRVYAEDFPPEACKELSPSQSPCMEASMSVCKICSDVCVATIQSETSFKVSMDNIVACPSAISLLDESVLNSALGLLKSIGTGGARGHFGLLESIAESGFNIESEAVTAMSGLKQYLAGITSVESSALTETFTWKRPEFLNDIITDDGLLTTTESMIQNPALWPYIVVCSSILGVLSNPKSSEKTASLSFSVMENLCKISQLPDFIQPVVADLFSMTFLSLGGIISLTGALGRFGTLKNDSNENGIIFAKYLISRGSVREKFWAKWASDHKVEVQIDPKTGKPIVAKGGKDDKKKDAKKDDKKKDKNAAAVLPPIVTDVELQFEPDADNEDPNHGPNISQWNLLLNVGCDDLHAFCEYSTPLTCSTQCGLSEISLQLINDGADVNAKDSAGLSPLMYSIVLGDIKTIPELIKAGSDIDAIDSEGNPIFKYACLCLSSADNFAILTGPLLSSQLENTSNIEVLGSPSVIDLLIEADVDFNVSDAEGNSPLLCCLGLGKMNIVLGGYKLVITNSAYSSGFDVNNILEVIIKIVNAGGQVNFCNKKGVVPMHVVSAYGHIDLINYLISVGALPNAVDQEGYIPLHYIAASCPENSIETFDLVLNYSKQKHLEQMIFEDIRSGKSKEEKYEIDVKTSMNALLSESYTPSTISKLRLSVNQLILLKSVDEINLLQLCMCAHILKSDAFNLFVKGGKDERVNLALHLTSKCKDDSNLLTSFYSNVDNFGMNVLHSSSLLFAGHSERRTLTDKEKRCKRRHYYESNELELLDTTFSNCNIDTSLVCCRVIEALKLESDWTALHGAIASGNNELIITLIKSNKFPLNNSDFPYLFFLSQVEENKISNECIESFVTCYLENDFSAILSEVNKTFESTPLTYAVRNKNSTVIKALLNCMQVNANVQDDKGMTAIHEACVSGNLDIVSAFDNGRDRIDFLIENADGNSCIETVVRSKFVSILIHLIEMRPNDVFERLMMTRTSNDDKSLLIELEEANIQISNAMGKSIIVKDESEITNSLETLNINAETNVLNEASNSDKISITVELEPTYDPEPIVVEVVSTSDIYTNMSDDEKLDALSENLKILKPILLSMKDASVIDLSTHAHECFSTGSSYSEQCNSQ
jgi:ankyrin repeat protein